MNNKTELVFFDIDDTLMHTTAMIAVVKKNEVVKRLTNQEFNNYILGEDESFDFSEFRDAKKFATESKPIRKIIKRLMDYLNKGSDVRLLTARADFDCKETFLNTFIKYGIPIHQVHVHRTGNLTVGTSPAEKKAIWVRRYIANNNYRVIKLYDDSTKNLEVFQSLSSEYPSIKFESILVKE